MRRRFLAPWGGESPTDDARGSRKRGRLGTVVLYDAGPVCVSRTPRVAHVLRVPIPFFKKMIGFFHTRTLVCIRFFTPHTHSSQHFYHRTSARTPRGGRRIKRTRERTVRVRAGYIRDAIPRHTLYATPTERNRNESHAPTVALRPRCSPHACLPRISHLPHPHQPACSSRRLISATAHLSSWP